MLIGPRNPHRNLQEPSNIEANNEGSFCLFVSTTGTCLSKSGSFFFFFFKVSFFSVPSISTAGSKQSAGDASVVSNLALRIFWRKDADGWTDDFEAAVYSAAVKSGLKYRRGCQRYLSTAEEAEEWKITNKKTGSGQQTDKCFKWWEASHHDNPHSPSSFAFFK